MAPLPDPVAQAVRAADVETFMTGLFDQLYGQLDPAIVDDLRNRRRVRQDVLLGRGHRCSTWARSR